MLFPSTLIVSNSKTTTESELTRLLQKVGHEITPNNPDIFIINSTTGWGIDVVRQIKSFLANKPYNHQNKIILVHDAHQLQVEAQNSLLKILEEPGDTNYIILTTSKPNHLLPTILSRCHLINLGSSNKPESNSVFTVSTTLSENFITSEKLAADKENLIMSLEKQLSYYHQQLINHPSPENKRLAEKLIKAIQMINANVDPKSTLDYFFLT